MHPAQDLGQRIKMAVGTKLVSKRSARIYVDDEMEKETSEYQSKRMTMIEETASDISKKSSTSTATSPSSQSSRQTSLEVEQTKTEMVSPETLVQEGDGSQHGASVVFGANQGHAFLTNPGPEEVLPTVGRPINFGVVVPGVYRSSFPQTGDYPFIEGLKLKTMVTLVQKDFPPGYQAFLGKNGIKHHVFDMKGTKKEEIPIKTMKSILRLVLDRQNHPLLIHCNHGRHRTGCVVAVVRKVSGWNVGHVLDEYKNFAEPKIRECDVKYINNFELAEISNLFRDVGWRVRTQSFIRATIFTLFVLVIWLFSGNRLAEAPRRKLEK